MNVNIYSSLSIYRWTCDCPYVSVGLLSTWSVSHRADRDRAGCSRAHPQPLCSFHSTFRTAYMELSSTCVLGGKTILCDQEKGYLAPSTPPKQSYQDLEPNPAPTARQLPVAPNLCPFPPTPTPCYHFLSSRLILSYVFWALPKTVLRPGGTETTGRSDI
jgi:hypothetical protein